MAGKPHPRTELPENYATGRPYNSWAGIGYTEREQAMTPTDDPRNDPGIRLAVMHYGLAAIAKGGEDVPGTLAALYRAIEEWHERTPRKAEAQAALEKEVPNG